AHDQPWRKASALSTFDPSGCTVSIVMRGIAALGPAQDEYSSRLCSTACASASDRNGSGCPGRFSRRRRWSSGSLQATSMNLSFTPCRSARPTHCSRAGSTALTASMITSWPEVRTSSAIVSATRYAASPVGWSLSMPALRIAASIGSTDTTDAPSRPPRTCAMVLLPEPGNPAIAISTTYSLVLDLNQFGAARDDRDRVVLEGKESVLGIRRDRTAIRRHTYLAAAENSQHRLMAGQETDLADRGARHDHRGGPCPHLTVR